MYVSRIKCVYEVIQRIRSYRVDDLLGQNIYNHILSVYVHNYI